MQPLSMENYSVNKAAVAMIKDSIARADELQIKAWRAECGAMLVDMGLNCPGSWKAGQVFVEAGYGGLGKATYGVFDLPPFRVPTHRRLGGPPGDRGRRIAGRLLGVGQG